MLPGHSTAKAHHNRVSLLMHCNCSRKDSYPAVSPSDLCYCFNGACTGHPGPHVTPSPF